MAPMSRRIDAFLKWVKWPVAIISLVLLPGAMWALGTMIRLVVDNFGGMLPFWGGFGAYLAGWYFIFRKPGWGSYLSTFEHEITHALFAVLTFHKVTSMKTSWHDGGSTTFQGRGNWLVTIAPYFFPTVSIILAALLWLVPESLLMWANALLGASLAYHFTSTWLETHFRQTDLNKASLPFSLMFLPTANVALYGLLFAFAADGQAGMSEYFGALLEKTGELFTAVIELV